MALDRPSENPAIQDGIREIEDDTIQETNSQILEFNREMFEYYDSVLAENIPALDTTLDAPVGVANWDLPTANIKAGRRFNFYLSGMDSDNYYVIRSSNGETIHSFDYSADGAEGELSVIATVDNPTTASHWRVLNHSASVTVSVVSSGQIGSASTNILKIFYRDLKWILVHAPYGISTNLASVASSASGAVPSELCPEFTTCYDVANIGGGYISMASVSTAGVLRINYFLLGSGAASSNSAITAFSISYTK